MFPRAVSASVPSVVDLSIAPPSAAAPRAVADPLSLAGLDAAVEDARAAALVPGGGLPDPTSFASLRLRLGAARAALPPSYRRAVADPLLRTLDRLGASGFARVLAEDPGRQGAARLLLDVAQAVLQHGDGEARPTAAFQEVVSDLYDGFLASDGGGGAPRPDHGTVAPLVRWSSADTGPYTWSATATGSVGVKAAIVSLPVSNATAGVLAWPALAHEAAGHDVLAAYDGARDELSRAVRERLLDAGVGRAVASYWADRIDETASDVLGVLNMGPAAAVGLVGYFRALNGAWRGTPSLRSAAGPEDPHPPDVARAYVAAETVRLLSFDGAARWADRLGAEADRDRGRIVLGDVAVSADVARTSAAVVAQTVVGTRLRALEGRSFGDLQQWRDEDEAVVAALRRALRGKGAVPAAAATGAYAAHAVAAAVYEAVSGSTAPAEVMPRMVGVLAAMHERSATWAPAARRGPGEPRVA